MKQIELVRNAGECQQWKVDGQSVTVMSGKMQITSYKCYCNGWKKGMGCIHTATLKQHLNDLLTDYEEKLVNPKAPTVKHLLSIVSTDPIVISDNGDNYTITTATKTDHFGSMYFVKNAHVAYLGADTYDLQTKT